MADALVSLVVESLASMTIQEMSLLVGVKKDLEKLSRALESLQAALKDAEKRRVKDELVRNWLGKLTDVAYDMDDVLEEWKVVMGSGGDDEVYMSGADHEKVGARSFPSCSFYAPFFDRFKFRLETGRRIKVISRRLDEIKDHKDRFSFIESKEEDGGAADLDTMETSSLIDETQIFGRDRDRERIVSWLVSESGSSSSSSATEDHEVPVICIAGMGGIGKTTVAQLVYKDERVKRHFDERIWVSLSHDFDVMRIYSSIVKISTGWKFSEFESHKKLHGIVSSLEDLQPTIQAVLQGKQFLLVLDGVRNVDQVKWERLMIPLNEAAIGSKILVTTRNEYVTKAFAVSTQMHELQPLFENDCWLLFSHRAFLGGGGRRRRRIGDGDEDERVKLEAVGREIVSKCQGIPLLAKALGTALRNKRDVCDWQFVLQGETWDSLAGEKIVPNLLLVSFHDMPQHLKQCFAFCSIFPKDHLIDKDKLIKLWMAQGFILPQGRQVDMERVGGFYFDDLMRRSLFQIIETDENGTAKYCTMHDMIHDLCKSVVSECFIVHEKTPDHDLLKARHASWICSGDVESIPPFIHKARNLRTLLLIGWSKIPNISHRFFRSLKRLRALDLSGSRIRKLPHSLHNLKLLRYLDLSATEIHELPEFVSGLCLLQTLKLNHCHNLGRLPKGIVKLINLRHLETEGTCLEYLPEGIGRLTSLRTLTKFVPGHVQSGCKITELKNLHLIQGALEITCLNRVASRDEASEANLDKKQNLQTLRLSCKAWMSLEKHQDSVVNQVEGVFESLQPHSNLRDLTISDYIGRQFPTWMEDSSLYSNLTKMQLSYCQCQVMPALGKLPSLKWLKVKAMFEVREVGSEFCVGSHGGVMGAFPKLEILIFERMYIWEKWDQLNVGNGSFPSLFQLCFESCDKLKALPEFQNLTSLQELKIRDCPILKDRCRKEVGEDWNKIGHISNITIDGAKIK